jgi:MYXO-CTERM domain-containing protein
MDKSKIASAVVLAAVLAAPTVVMAQASPGDPQTADNDDGGEWGWVGLLGLLGLLGLRRRDSVDVTARRSATTTVPRT